MPSEHAAIKLKSVLRGLKPVQGGNKLEIPTLMARLFAESSAFYPPALKLQPNKRRICIKRRTLACVKKQKYPVRTSLKPNNRAAKQAVPYVEQGTGIGLKPNNRAAKSIRSRIRSIRSIGLKPNNRAAKSHATRLTERTAAPASGQIAEPQNAGAWLNRPMRRPAQAGSFKHIIQNLNKHK